MLQVNHLVVGYGAAPIVRDVSLSADGGSFTCIVGPNGCGKTTLLKAILQLLPPTSGSVTCDGVDLAGLTAAERARLIAYIPQIHRPPFPFSVFDVVAMGRTAHLDQLSRFTAHDKEIASAAIAQLGLESVADHSYTTLSGGQRQLVLIARAIAQQASHLLMDEPTSSLDYGNQFRVLDQVAELAASGLCVVMVTHDPAHAFHCADRVLVMADGVLVDQGSPAQAMTESALSELYGLDLELHQVALRRGGSAPVAIPLRGITRPIPDALQPRRKE